MNKAPCKECKERTIEPNCHDICEKYREFRNYKTKVQDAKNDAFAVANYKYGRMKK